MCMLLALPLSLHPVSCSLSCCPQHGCRMAALRTLPLLLLLLSASALGCRALTPPDERPQPHNLPPSLGFGNGSDGGLSVDLPMALRVFSVDYHHVQAPFEIVLWIMLASLAKLGEAQLCFCSRVNV